MSDRCRHSLSSAVLVLCALASAHPALAQKFISGTIAVDQTLDTVGGAVYRVNGNVTVNAGVTLTIEPGVTLKFESARSLTVGGTLFAEGGSSPDSMIVFTSIKDDSAPLNGGEDTNADGTATLPLRGDWSYLQFNGAGSSGSSLRWCTIRYGGSGTNGLVSTTSGAAPSLVHCDLSYGYRGIWIYAGSAPIIRDSSFNEMTTVPVYLSLMANPDLDNLIFAAPSGNDMDAIQLYEAAVIGSATLARASATVGGIPLHSLPYQVTATVDIGAGESLQIEPGVVLKFSSGIYVNNAGLLTAMGGATADSLIYFTSIDDDNAPAPTGHDTNTNGNDTFPDQYDWGGIRFQDSADDNSLLRHCLVHFAGSGSSSYGAIYCSDASPSLVHCDLTAAYYGVLCTGSASPRLVETSINAMTNVPVAIDIGCSPVFDNLVFESTSDNGFDAIGIRGGTLVGSNTLRVRAAQLGALPIDNLTYVLLGNISVAAGANLTVDPGVIIKPQAAISITVDGALHMDGTADPDSQIVVTSYKDDTAGNPADTNNDGSVSAPAKGDWGSIIFNAGATGSVIHAAIRFCGWYTGTAIRCMSTSPTLSDLAISDCNYGIDQSGTSSSVIANVAFANTTYSPVLMSVSADPVFSGITFTNVGLQAIGLASGTIGVDSVLRVRSMAGFANISYYLPGYLTIATGANLRIEPGVVTKFASASAVLTVNGSLRAVGTPDSTIVFTAINDDARGIPGDTAGNGSASQAPAQWGYLVFEPTSEDAACQVRHCEFAYGGGHPYPYLHQGVITCNSASPTVRDNLFSTNHRGVDTTGNAAPLVQDNHFFHNTSTPLATSVSADPAYVANTFDQNGIHAVGMLGETLTADATLEKLTNFGMPSYPYYFLGTVTVGPGVTMTVEPGVVIKSSGYSNPIAVSGALQMAGTPTDRIILTAISDDSVGGDSDVNGGATTPVIGAWTGINFNDSADDANCLVENCLFRYAGNSSVISTNSASPTIRDNEFELCYYGLQLLNSSNPLVQDNLFRVLSWYPVEKSLAAQPVFVGNVLDNVNYHCIAIRGQSIGQDMTLRKWDFAGYTNITQVLVYGTLTVQLGATLTIEPGVVLKLAGTKIDVYGSLIAAGTIPAPIVFTSLKDDSAGNPADTNQDGSGTAPAKSDWQNIYFDVVSDDVTAVLDHCELRYGSTNMVHCKSASPTISNCRIESCYYGLYTEGTAAPVVAGCDFDDCYYTPVLMSLVSDPQFSDIRFLSRNGFNGLGIEGATLASDATIRRRSVAGVASIPYRLEGNLTAGYSSILRIQPGVTIKSNGQGILVQKGLIAEGKAEPDSQIVFTSDTDDFYGGDSNNDGSATAASYHRWGRIVINNEAIDDSTRFRHVVFRNGYSYPSVGTIEVNSANPRFDHCAFVNNGLALDYTGTAGDPARGWIHDCDFYDNTYQAVRNQGTAFTVDATGNWWGHASGPLDNSDDTGSGGYFNPGGLGDPVSNKVNYGAWKTEGIQNVLLGDVSRNGDIRAYDASLVLQATVQAPGFLGPLQEVLADVDCSGSYSALDAALILRYVARLDTHFPCALDSTQAKDLDGPLAWQNFAPVAFDVDLGAVSLGAGEAAWVPVGLSGSGAVLGQEYHVRFDPTVVGVRGVRLLPSAAGSLLAWNVLGGNELRISLASPEPLEVVDAVEFELVGGPGLTGPTAVLTVCSFARLNDVVLQGASGTDDTLPGLAGPSLAQNLPNPFNPSTHIRYTADRDGGPVRLMVLDTRGRVVRTLVDQPQPAGEHVVEWNGRDDRGRRVGSGVYLYRLEVGGRQLVRKMVLLK